MRKEIIECETLEQAQEQAPWSSKIEKIEGGFMAFESNDDFLTWSNQK